MNIPRPRDTLPSIGNETVTVLPNELLRLCQLDGFDRFVEPITTAYAAKSTASHHATKA
jgi:hypothetical protein